MTGAKGKSAVESHPLASMPDIGRSIPEDRERIKRQLKDPASLE